MSIVKSQHLSGLFEVEAAPVTGQAVIALKVDVGQQPGPAAPQ